MYRGGYQERRQNNQNLQADYDYNKRRTWKQFINTNFHDKPGMIGGIAPMLGTKYFVPRYYNICKVTYK